MATTSSTRRILALEPYYGGSHQAFLEGWQRYSRHTWTTLTLPAFKWKWRMRQSSLLFAWEVKERLASGQGWDLLLCSDMLNLAEFLGLAPLEVRRIPSIVYFHENQITYPVRVEKDRDYHFGVTNIASAVAAEEVWFNSQFHRDSFLEAIPAFLDKMPDHRPLGAVELIRTKARVRSPGVEEPTAPPARTDGPLHIVWAARWEYDKNPEGFFDALGLLADRGVEFRLSVLGQRFRESPAVFEEARSRLKEQIVQWGYVEDAEAFGAALAAADVFVSTALHEFFGLAAVEAIAAGAYPLLPDRLAYPELLELCEEGSRSAYFYDGTTTGLCERLVELSARKAAGELSAATARAAVQRFSWSQVGPRLDDAMEALV